jgi:hypothetical protein
MNSVSDEYRRSARPAMVRLCSDDLLTELAVAEVAATPHMPLTPATPHRDTTSAARLMTPYRAVVSSLPPPSSTA